MRFELFTGLQKAGVDGDFESVKLLLQDPLLEPDSDENKGNLWMEWQF